MKVVIEPIKLIFRLIFCLFMSNDTLIYMANKVILKQQKTNERVLRSLTKFSTCNDWKSLMDIFAETEDKK